MENVDIYCSQVQENCSQVQFPVKIIGSFLVPPSRPSPKTILYLSNLDDHLIVSTRFDALLVYNNASHKIHAATNPVKVIRDALSQVLSYYYPLAGRVRRTQDGCKLQVECTGEGALFVEAITDNTFSTLGEFEELKSSFEHLLFQFPLTAEVEQVPPLIFQVTRFHCGSFVVGVSFKHSLCDGQGASQFLNGLAEIARGEAKLSIEPVWQRENLKPYQPYQVRFQHEELLESGYHVSPNYPTMLQNELVLASISLNWDAVQRLKQPIAEELKENCTTFEVLAALAWRVRTRALGIPLDQAVRLLFAVNVRKALDPPLAEGYYGNGMYLACARTTTAAEVVNGSLSLAVKLIKKAKVSVNDEYLRSGIAFLEMKRSSPEIMDVRLCVEDAYLTDWRSLGFDKVDFGWGEPVIACPGNWIKYITCPISFMLPQNTKSGAIIIFCVPRAALASLQTETHDLV